MPDLVAQGPLPQQRWRRRLPPEQSIVVGRDAGSFSVAWDDRVSRQHANLLWRNGELTVEQRVAARNPMYVRGRRMERFTVRPGEHFVIGDTTFTLTDEQVKLQRDTPADVKEKTFSPDYLHTVPFLKTDQRIEVLSRIPEMIGGSSTDTEIFTRLVNLLFDAIPSAHAAAVVKVGQEEPAAVAVLQWDRRGGSSGAFTPSERLIRQAVSRRESTVHVWSEGAGETIFTQGDNMDWAFCTPLTGEVCRGEAIYVTGRQSVSGRAQSPDELQDDVKFVELAASTVSSLRSNRLLERRQASLRQFLSPVVLDALQWQDPEVVLAPREVDVSVLFCDLRGFARRSERSADDLLGLLNRVSGALGVMTRHILEEGGVVGDFQGDAAMGFWGWPLDQQDYVQRACRAALAIRAAFEAAAQDDQHPLRGFRVGIGLATGRVVAGKIGSVDQVKVTVFGPVVNLASRLESMTKLLRAPVLMDETTAKLARAGIDTSLARVRRLARVRPFQMDMDLEVSELLPPRSQFPQLSDQDIETYEQALDAMVSRDWERAIQLLHQVPADDQVKDFLMVFIAQHGRTPPAEWDGVIPLNTK